MCEEAAHRGKERATVTASSQCRTPVDRLFLPSDPSRPVFDDANDRGESGEKVARVDGAQELVSRRSMIAQRDTAVCSNDNRIGLVSSHHGAEFANDWSREKPDVTNLDLGTVIATKQLFDFIRRRP